MNRSQRKYGFPMRPPKRCEFEIKTPKVKTLSLEDPNYNKRKVFRTFMHNRCCQLSPALREFGHVTDSQDSDQSPGPVPPSVPILPPAPPSVPPSVPVPPSGDVCKDIKRWHKIITSNTTKVDKDLLYKSSFRNKPKLTPAYVETSDGIQWHNLENIDDIYKYIDRETLTFGDDHPKSYRISSTPRVKLIAEKFTKYKHNNIEVRKLDEKLVCVEYDVYDCSDDISPVQTMRVFCSVKPESLGDKAESLNKIPSGIKKKFDISPDITKHSEQEVEIIDDKLAENKPYLEDLMKLLRRKQNCATRRNTQSLDLQSLYEIARKDCRHFDRDGAEALLTNELQEIKELILKKCNSCAHGINRHTVRRDNMEAQKDTNNSAVSTGLFAELIRNTFCTKK